ncbi:MAG: hypothetical protein ACAI44_38510 [Candidatus Sericytochromatia bacterium]
MGTAAVAAIAAEEGGVQGPASALGAGERLALSQLTQPGGLPGPLRFEAAGVKGKETVKGTVKGPVKGPVKVPVKAVKVKEAEPAPAPDPDAGIEKPLRLSGSSRAPEKADEALYEMYLSLQREVRDDLARAGATVSEADKKDLILTKLLMRMGQESLYQLSEAQQEAIGRFAGQFEFKDLVLAEVQSEGGADAVEGIVTGTGVDGHYTSSMLRSLQGLLASGRLTPELLTALDELSKAPLHAELAPQRLTLLRSTLQELAFPERIEQHSKGTCAPTTIQILLALKDPVKYTRIVTALAGPEGSVPAAELNGRNGLLRESETLKDDRSGRSLSSRLLQPALMEYGNGDQNYDNAKDRNSDGRSEYAGLAEEGSVRLLEALFGPGTYAVRYAHASPDPSWKGYVTPEVFRQELVSALAHGQPVPAGMRWGESGHKILLTRMDQAKGLAYFMNPWGELQHMPLETFLRRVDSASLPKPVAGERDVLSTLPGQAARAESYEPIHNWRYYKVTDYLLEDPVLKNLSEERKTLLRDRFRTLKLSPDYASRQLDVLSRLARVGLADDRLFERLAAVRDKDELSAVVRLYGTFDKLPLDQFTALLDAEPDKNLDPIYYAMLMDDLDKPDIFAPLLAKALANKAAAADGSDQPARQLQAGLKDAFVALEAGDIKRLKSLAAQADETTRAFMLKRVMDSWPASTADQACDLLSEGLDSRQLKYVLQTVSPNHLVYGGDDAVRRFLRTNVRLAAREREKTHS